VLPLLVLPRVTLRPRFDRAVRHAGMAAITALLVSSVTGHAEAGDLRPTHAAVAVGVALAVRGAAMLRAVSIGGLTYVAVVVVSTTVG
jgi:branched-subunit amino acid transport protein